MLPNRKETKRNSVLIAVGANLPDAQGRTPIQICERAVQAIKAIPGLTCAVRSRWYSSAPIPPSEQSRYINGIVHIVGSIAPEILLNATQTIEHEAGRVRHTQNAARTLDLDIIDMAGLIRAAPDPVLPHPRTHLRAFVLLPLRDVMPDWVHPVTGEGIQSLIDALPEQDIGALK